MDIEFDDNIPQAKREFYKCMESRHQAKIMEIISLIKKYGLHSIPPKYVKHLWDDIYELRPDNRRVIFIKINKKKGIVLKVYIKKSNKMPKNIKQTIEQREKQFLGKE